jgi:kumamolisin
MEQSRVVVKGTERTQISGAKVIGRSDDKLGIRVTVEVRRKKVMPLPASFGRVLGRDELVAEYGAAPEDLAAVRDFAVGHGLQVLEESPAKRIVTLAGSVADFSKAFGVELNEVSVGGKTHRQRVGAVSVPGELGSIVTDVRGLDTRRQANPHYRRAGRAGAQPRVGAQPQPLSPLDVARLYNFPAGDGAGQTIAIIELGGGFSEADLKTYFTGLGLPVPTVTAVSVGAVNDPGTDPDSDGEVMLDIEVSGAMAPKAKILVYFASNTDQGFLGAIQSAIHDSHALPAAVSISWGDAESLWKPSSMQSFEKAFQDAAALGVPVFVAAGDNGSADGQSGLNADFPASAPHAIGCGGTDLFGKDGVITSEVVWNGGNQGGASGGGVSSIFPKPAYQSGAHVPSPTGAGGGRGVPDVTGCGGDLSPYKVRVDGADTNIWGTSAVAPLWSGMIARFALGPMPAFHTLLYNTTVAHAGLHDITKGNNDISGENGPYKAGLGWDACSGLGSPNGTALRAALKAQTSTSTTTHQSTLVSTT